MILVYMEGKFIDLSDLVHLKLDSVNVSWCSVIQYQYIFSMRIIHFYMYEDNEPSIC